VAQIQQNVISPLQLQQTFSGENSMQKRKQMFKKILISSLVDIFEQFEQTPSSSDQEIRGLLGNASAQLK